MVLTTFLLNERRKGNDSKWKEYIKNQPVNIELLQDWDNNELDELQDEHVYYDVGMLMKAELDLYYNWKRAVLKADFPDDLIGYELFSWARRIVTTRSFGKFCPYITLAPIAEFFNHNNTQTYYTYGSKLDDRDYLKRYESFNLFEDNDDEIHFEEDILKFTLLKNVSRKKRKNHIESNKISEVNNENFRLDIENKSEDKQLIIRSGDEEYEKGSEVFLTYGRYSNYMLLRTYGFAIKNNCYDYAKLIVTKNNISSGKSCEKSTKTLKKYLFKIKLDILCLGLVKYIKICNLDYSLNEILKIYSRLIKHKTQNFTTSLNEDLLLLEKDLNIKLYYAVRAN